MHTITTQLRHSTTCCQEFENEKIVSQIVGSGKWCDQNGDSVSTSDKSYYICMIRLKRLLVKCEKYGALSIQILLYLYLNFSHFFTKRRALHLYSLNFSSFLLYSCFLCCSVKKHRFLFLFLFVHSFKILFYHFFVPLYV